MALHHNQEQTNRFMGTIVGTVSPEEFFAHPQHEKTRQFLGQILSSHHHPRAA